MSAPETFAGEEGDGSALISNLHAILWQRRWLLIVPFVLCSVAGLAAAFLLPRTYESRAVLLVESQNLPVDIGTNPAGEVIDRRIARIREQILSRPDLIALIQANNLYDAASHGTSLTDLVQKMRDATDISPVSADIAPTRGGSSSIAFALTFNYPRPAQAQLVAQAFVDRLLRLDAQETQSQAADNVRFLQDQQSNLQDQITAIEGQINQITGREGVALSNAGGSAFMLGVGGGTGAESQIASIQRDNAQLSAQIGTASVDRDAQVVAAEARLAAAKAVYADDHPDVKLAQSQLEAARRVAAQRTSGDNDAAIRRQIASNNALIGQIRRQQQLQESRAATIMAAQARGPAVLQQVNQLQARADSLRGNLSRINQSLVNAQSMAKLAGEQRAEHLTLIDPPVTPDKPTKPNRLVLIGGGIVGGLGLGLGLVLLMELVMRPIRSVATLTRLVGAPPLGVVPVLTGRRAPKKRRFFPWPFRRKPAA